MSIALAHRSFAHSLHCEWLKQRRSLASWMVLVGAFFTPAIITVVRLLHPADLPQLHAHPDFWRVLWHDAWESTAIFFLPMGTVLATSLIVQIEYRNNAWKLVHALPLGPATIYFSKLAIILAMLVLFLALFNLGIWLTAAVPAMLLTDLTMPHAPIPFDEFLGDNLRYLLACLPIVTLQYLLSLRFGNFMVPVGIGFMLWVASLAALSARWSALVPYTHTMLEYLRGEPDSRLPVAPVDVHWLSLGYAMLFTALGFALFALRRHKG